MAGLPLPSHCSYRPANNPPLLRRFAAFAVYLAFIAVQFYSADRSGNFWWYDSASHALNGVFLRDFFANNGWSSPLTFAVSYFVQYPGITIGFYPPGFAVLLAVFYAVFGVSHAAAQLCVSITTLVLALGIHALAIRCGMRFWPAFCAGLLAIGFPEMLLWGRQIQPELPAYAFAVWSVYFLFRWIDENRLWQVLLAVVLFVFGLYVKQTICFLAPVLLLIVIVGRGFGAFRQRAVYIAAAVAIVLMVPLAILTLTAGSFNLVQAVASPDKRSTLQAITYYAQVLPKQVGWLPLIAALVGIIVLLRRDFDLPRLRWLFIGWVAVGLVFFTSISLKSPRFSTAILPAVAVLAVVPFIYARVPRWADFAAIGATAAVVTYWLLTVPVPRVSGAREAAEVSATMAEPDSNILLLAHRSANFIFAMRAYTIRSDVRMLRAEKLYTKYKISQQFGQAQGSKMDADALLADLTARNVSMVVLQRGFWQNVPVLQLLADVVHSPNFVLLKSIKLEPHHAAEPVTSLDIYHRLDYRYQPEPDIVLDIPLIGGHFSVPRKPGR
jgi:hypothetical protein